MKNFFLLLLSIGLFTACNQTAKHEDHDHDNSSEAITLINGEKWKINEEMKPNITEAEEVLNNYIKANGTDYKTLASELKDKNTALVKSCTMTGESHEELHKWLHPHIELIKELHDAENETEAQEVIAELQKSFSTLHQYFE
ncbi:MAG: hypothetical protein BGO32_07800 [Bacteroidetes bacterium 37-13]|nr:MAG: hypothetical protein BGO32_07800 [Bacteroidetes bacterium 37-13]